MSWQSLAGLLALNLFALGVGSGLLWGIRGWVTWVELARLAGFAYLLGIAGLGIALTLELVVGVPFSLATILVTGAVLAAAGVAVGVRLGRPRPALGSVRLRSFGLAAAALAALVIVYLEALFRSARLSGLNAWDAWSFWVPKAQAIYVFGELDEQFFSELANPTYPPLVPTLEATAFTFMGSADVVTLHVQFWFLLVGFVGAVAGLLAPRVSPVLLWSLLLLVLVSPRSSGRTLDPQADFTLDYFFALATLLVAFWLLERQPWQLAVGDGLPRRDDADETGRAAARGVPRGRGSPRLVAGLAAGMAAVGAGGGHRLRADDPVADLVQRARPHGRGARERRERVPGHRPLVARFESVLAAWFDSGLWTIVVPLAIAAIVLAFLAGARLLPVFAALVYGFALAGFTWAIWAFTELELPISQDESVNPVVRLTGGVIILSAALVPLLLDAAWRGGDPAPAEDAEWAGSPRC